MASCDNCRFLGAEYDPALQCLQAVPVPNRATGVGMFPQVEPAWWCGMYMPWVEAAAAVAAGNNQTVPVGQLAPVAPSVLVTDASGRPVYGAEVTFAVASGGGAITGEVQTTGRDGIAAVGSWTVGNIAGANSLTATVGALPVVTFDATGEAAIITVAGGDAQTAVAGSVLPVPPSVLVTDQALNPLAGVSVAFNPTGGGGTFGSVQGSPAVTDANGIAAPISWTLGVNPGLNTLSAFSAVTAVGSPALFTATAT